MSPNNAMPVVTTKERTLRGLACKTLQEASLYLHLNNEYLPQVVTASAILVAARRATQEFIANPDQVILNLKVSLHQEMGDIGIKLLETLMSVEKEFLGLPDKEVDLQTVLLKRIRMNINNEEIMVDVNKTQ